MRTYPLHFYTEAGWLKVPFVLWLTLGLGVQHLWFLAPAMHKLLPEAGELLLDLRLLSGDVLVLILLAAVGHRMEKGGLELMRWIWRHGWWLLVAAYVLHLAGFVWLRHDIISWAGHRNYFWSWGVLIVNVGCLLYLLFSTHSRDVFRYVPQAPGQNTGKKGKKGKKQSAAGGSKGEPDAAASETPQADGSIPEATPAQTPNQTPSAAPTRGQALRRQSAEKILAQYPVPADAPEQLVQARARLLDDLENAQLWHDLGIFALQQNAAEQAADFVAQACLIDGTNAIFHRNLGELHRRCGRIPEAIEAGQSAIRLNRNDPEAHFNMGVIFMTANRLQESAKCYEQVLKLQPDHQAARTNLGAILGRPVT
jgi:hypothetical protein